MKDEQSAAGLEQLLREDEAHAAERARTAFRRTAGARAERVVIFGAGQLGRKLLSVLRSAGLKPLAFADNNPALRGREVEGLRVLPPAEAARSWSREAAWVVAVASPGPGRTFGEIAASLRALGCECVVPFLTAAWAYPDGLLPHYSLDLPQRVLAQKENVRKGLDLWADEESRREYVSQAAWRIAGEYAGILPVSPEPPYFPTGIYRPYPGEFFVDCGAFDGDTLRPFLARQAKTFAHFLALEPDPANFAKLQTQIAAQPEDVRRRITAQQVAVAERRGKAAFAASGSGASALAAGGTCEVECVPLDELLADAEPTMIKMDIEGAEEGALRGCRATLSRCAPVLAISVYHRQGDLWRLPLLIRQLAPDHALYLRRYENDWLDEVCYAVPPGRRVT